MRDDDKVQRHKLIMSRDRSGYYCMYITDENPRLRQPTLADSRL